MSRLQAPIEQGSVVEFLDRTFCELNGQKHHQAPALSESINWTIVSDEPFADTEIALIFKAPLKVFRYKRRMAKGIRRLVTYKEISYSWKSSLKSWSMAKLGQFPNPTVLVASSGDMRCFKAPCRFV